MILPQSAIPQPAITAIPRIPNPYLVILNRESYPSPTVPLQSIFYRIPQHVTEIPYLHQTMRDIYCTAARLNIFIKLHRSLFSKTMVKLHPTVPPPPLIHPFLPYHRCTTVIRHFTEHQTESARLGAKADELLRHARTPMEDGKDDLTNRIMALSPSTTIGTVGYGLVRSKAKAQRSVLRSKISPEIKDQAKY